MPNRCRAVRLMMVVALAGLLQACDIDLYTNLGEREANAMVAVLLRDGVPASRKVQDNGQLTVVVDEKRFAQAMSLLDSGGGTMRACQRSVERYTMRAFGKPLMLVRKPPW